MRRLGLSVDTSTTANEKHRKHKQSTKDPTNHAYKVQTFNRDDVQQPVDLRQGGKRLHVRVHDAVQKDVTVRSYESAGNRRRPGN